MNLTKSKTAKYVAGFAGIALAFALVATPVFADTAADLQATINSLMAQIQAAQAQLSALNGGTTTTTTTGTGTGYTFNTNLTVGSTGVDVMNLQKVLNMSADTQVAATGAGSPGNETSYFGGLTKAAVMKFQTKYGISPVAGYVGPITRAKLNTMSGAGGSTTTTVTTTTAGCTGGAAYSSTTGQPCSGTTTTTTLPTGGNLTVTAGVQPANSLAPQSANRVPFTTITLTAGSSDVTVNSITVQRSGLAQDAVFAGVVLVDNSNGLQIGIAKTLNSNHQALIGDPFVIPAGTSKTLTIAGNMASSLSSYAGQVASLEVVAVNTSATVAGSLPIAGAQQTINSSLTLGSATISSSSFDPNNGSSEPIGTTGYRFSGFRITAGSAEDLTLSSVRWNQTGSVGSGDLANVVTYVNGTAYPTTISPDGKYYTSVFSPGIVIAKGNSVDVYIQGDIVGSDAAGRTAEFDVYKNTDLYLVGNTYGYGITAPVGTGVVSTTANHATVINTSSNPWFEGSQMSVTAGTVTLIGKAPEVAAQNIAVNVPNQVLGGFATNFSGEPVSVQSMYFEISTTSGSLPITANSPFSGITSVSLVDQNGNVVAGPVDATVADGSTAHGGTTSAASSYAWIHFTDTVTFPVGRAVYTLKGTIPSTWANGTTVNIYTEPYTDWTSVTGQTTGNSVSLSSQTTAISLNQMTVKSGNLAVNISAQPTSQNIVAGVQGLTIANYTLDASNSGEDVRLSSFPVEITDSNVATDLSGCQLYNGTQALNTGSNVVNTLASATAQTFSFDNSLVVPKGTVVTLSLECNVASGISGSSHAFYATAVTDTSKYTVTGQTSGNSITPTVGSSNGGTMTPATGSLTMSIDPSSPSYAVINGGATGVTVDVIKFHASTESMTLNKIGLNMPAGYGSSSDVITAYLYNGSQLLGTTQFVQGATSATSTLTTSLNLPKDTDVLVTVKADFADIGISQSGTEGKLIEVNPLNAQASGLSSGSTVNSALVSGTVAGVRVFNSYPTVVLDSTLPSTGMADGRLMHFKVTAANSGPVGLQQFVFQIATTTATVSNVGLYAYTDPGYSSPISSQTNGEIGNANLTLVNPNSNSGTAYATATPATNPVEVPAGSSLYFELRGSVTGVTTGASVVTTLLGDAAYPTNLTNGYYVATSTALTAAYNNHFVWSGNATSTSGIYDVDWSNSYGLPGFSSGGLIQTRSN